MGHIYSKQSHRNAVLFEFMEDDHPHDREDLKDRKERRAVKKYPCVHNKIGVTDHQASEFSFSQAFVKAESKDLCCNCFQKTKHKRWSESKTSNECQHMGLKVPNDPSIKEIYGLDRPLISIQYKHLAHKSQIYLPDFRIVQVVPSIQVLSKKLKKLMLENNLISSLPSSFSTLTALEELSLSDNLIAEFPTVITQLQNLKTLNLQRNKLTEIPGSIKNLEKLERLILSGNRLKELPCAIKHCKELKKLDVSNNPQFRWLPAGLKCLNKLRCLDSQNTAIVLSDLETLDKIGPLQIPSLKELISRSLMSSALRSTATDQVGPKILASTPKSIKAYLKSYQECSFCEMGVYFEKFVTRMNGTSISNTYFPVRFKLCKQHWKTEEDRLDLLFKTRSWKLDDRVEKLNYCTNTVVIYTHDRSSSWLEVKELLNM